MDTDTERTIKTLQMHGIVPFPKRPEPKLPSIDKLCEAIRKRKGNFDLSQTEETASAGVRLNGTTVRKFAANPAAAMASALAEALEAEPDGDDVSDVEDGDDEA